MRLQFPGMTLQHHPHQINPPVRRHVGKSNDPCVNGLFNKREFAEIRVNRHENTVFPRRGLKESHVTGVLP